VGGPKNVVMSEAFDQLCLWLQDNNNDDELHTLKELQVKLADFANGGEDVWTTKFLQYKLVAKYAANCR
jgi:hypothetical protein